MDHEQPDFKKRSCIKGYHIYKYMWEPAIREELVCKRERGNESDIYTVAVMKYGSIGHLRNTKKFVSLPYGMIRCQVLGHNAPQKQIVLNICSTLSR